MTCLEELVKCQKINKIINDTENKNESVEYALSTICDWLGFDSSILTISKGHGAFNDGHDVVSYYGYDDPVSSYLSSEYVTRCPGYKLSLERSVATRICDAPFDFKSTETYRNVLGPAGYLEGLTVPLFGNKRNGMLAMSTSNKKPLDEKWCMALTLMAPKLASIAEIFHEDLKEGKESINIKVNKSGGIDFPSYELVKEIPFSKEDLVSIAMHCLRLNRGGFTFYESSGGMWWKIEVKLANDGGGHVNIAIHSNHQPPMKITPRELDALSLINKGFSNNDIANKMGVSISTVKRHVENCLFKLNKSNRSALASYSSSQGLQSRIIFL